MDLTTSGRFLMQELDILFAKFFDPKATLTMSIRQEVLEQTKMRFYGEVLSYIKENKTNLSTRSSNFIDDVRKHNILIVVLYANLFPLNILSQSNVISEERV